MASSHIGGVALNLLVIVFVFAIVIVFVIFFVG